MKKILPLITLLSILTLAGCKKQNTAPTPTIANKYTPTNINIAYRFGQPQPVDQSVWTIYDFNHDDNADKKYIQVQIYNDDSARILEEPQSINNLAPNWPADIKSILWSPGAQFVVNDQYWFDLVNGSFVKSVYNQTSPQHAWLRTYKNTTAAFNLPMGEFTINFPNFQDPYHVVYSNQNAASVASSTNIGRYVLVPVGNCFNQLQDVLLTYFS